MSFLNALMLFGCLASLAPLLIYLLQRVRRRPVHWGAMQFLSPTLDRRSQRIQWDSLLLLALRTAIPTVLAICMARPVLTNYRSLTPQSAQVLTVLVDNSLSMQAPVELSDPDSSQPSTTHLQAAQSTLQQLSTDLRDVKNIRLRTTHASASPPAAKAISSDSREFRNAIERLALGGDAASLMRQLRNTLSSALGSIDSRRQVLLLSDFRQVDWQTVSDRDLAAVRDMCTSGPNPIQLAFLPVGERDRATSNMAIHLESRPTASSFVDESYLIRPALTNFGQQGRSVEVVFRVDGQALEKKTFDVDPRQPQLPVFACSFNRPGWHFLSVGIEDPLGMPADNRAFEVVRVLEPIRVLLVRPATRSQDSIEADFLRLALAPFQGQNASQNHFHVTSISANRLSADQILEMDALVMVGAVHLDETQTSLVQEFVAAGHGLLVFAGKSSNDRYQPAFQRGLLPATYASLESVMPSAAVVTGPDVQSVLTVPLQLDDGLEAIQFRRLWRLDKTAEGSEAIEDSAAGEPAFDRLLELSSGQPVLIGHPLGRGYVAQAAFGLDESWSNLSLRPVIVPLMQQLLIACSTSASEPFNVQCGDLLRGYNAAGQSTASVDRMATERGITSVEEWPEMQVASGGHATPLGIRVWLPGVFSTAALNPGASPALFSSAIDPAESDPTYLSAAELERLATRCGAEVVATPKAFSALHRQARDGTEAWRWLLAMLLMCLFAETWIASKIVRGTA